jgi:hypothetical protein
MNWGAYVIIVFGSFMIFITALVIKTYTVNTELVSNDYYKQELEYQSRISKMTHAREAQNKISIKDENDFLILSFSDSLLTNINGKIEFYRPSDASRDFTIMLEPDQNAQQKISKKNLIVGLYKIKIDWNSEGTDYYKEQDIYIQ